MKLPSPGFLLQAFAQVLRRFPATMIATITGVVALCLLIEGSQSNSDGLAKTFMTSLLGIPLLTALTVFAESNAWEQKKAWLLQGFGLAALAGYWFTLDPDASGFEYRELPGYMVLVMVAHLFVAVAPYLNKRPVRDFWEYNKDLFANIVVGVCFTMILYAGISLAILSVDELFDLGFTHVERIYLRLFFVMAGIFNTVYFLFHFPKSYEYSTVDHSYNVVFKNLCKYILIPIVLLYFVILYAYAFKIIGTWSLPRGWVSSLITGFSIAGIFTFLLNFYLPEQDGARHVMAYKRWFWWIVLPLTAMLFVAIARRIGEYGVTEERFLVAQMGVWLALNSLYFLFSKKDNIKFIPISMALFALSWAFGPFSAKAVSERSQIGRITGILAASGRMEGDKFKPGSTAITDLEMKQIESAVEFLERRGRLSSLNDRLPAPIDSLPEVPGYFGQSGKLRAWLGLGETSQEARDNKQVNVYAQTTFHAADIRGFASFRALNLNIASEYNHDEKGDYFELSKDGKRLEHIVFDGKTDLVVESYDLQPLIRKWLGQRPKNDSYFELSDKEKVVDFSGKKGSLRLVIENAYAEEGKTGCAMQNLNGYLFLK